MSKVILAIRNTKTNLFTEEEVITFLKDAIDSNTSLELDQSEKASINSFLKDRFQSQSKSTTGKYFVNENNEVIDPDGNVISDVVNEKPSKIK